MSVSQYRDQRLSGKQYNIAFKNNGTAVLLVQLFVDQYFGLKTKKGQIGLCDAIHTYVKMICEVK